MDVDPRTRLLLDARDGSRVALAEFVRATQAEVWRLSAWLVGRDLADDATQETFIAAWRALPDYRGEASARTWLLVIARRTAERVARRHHRWLELTTASTTGRLRVQQLAGTWTNSGPEASAEIVELLASLDSDRRTALVLTQVLGFSYEEASDICECPVGTIRSRVARARADLLAYDEAARQAGA